MSKQAVAAFVVILLLSSFVIADVPPIGESSCRTYEQARAQGVKGTDAELRAMGFCAGTTTTATKVTTTSNLGEMTLEQMYDYHAKISNEILALLNSADSNELKSRLDEIFDKSNEAQLSATIESNEELDRIWKKYYSCTDSCYGSYSCEENCHSAMQAERTAREKSLWTYKIQQAQKDINELKSVISSQNSVAKDTPTLPEPEQDRLKAAMQKAEKERTSENIEAAIQEAEKQNVAAIITRGSIKDSSGRNIENLVIGTKVKTNAPVKTKLAEGSEFSIGRNSEVQMDSPFGEGIKLISGKVKIWMGDLLAKRFIVRTPSGGGSVRGTEFVIEYNETIESTTVYLNEGSLDFTTNAGKTVNLEAGNILTVQKDGTTSVSKLNEKLWSYADSDFAKDNSFIYYFYLTFAVIIAETIAAILYLRKPKQTKKELGIYSLLFSIFGVLGCLFPIIGYTFALASTALARIQKKKKATLSSNLGYVIGIIGIMLNFFVFIAMYFFISAV